MTLATLGMPCLAMSDAFSSDSQDVAPVERQKVAAEAAADKGHDTAAVTQATDQPAIRRTPPVIPNLWLLPPVTAEQPQTAAVIPASSNNEQPAARQVAATVRADEKTLTANQVAPNLSPQIARGDLVPQSEAVNPLSERKLPLTHRLTRPAAQAPARLTANRFHQNAPAPPPAPEPIDPIQAGPGVEVAPEPVAEPAPAANDLTTEAPLAADESVSEDWEYGDNECGNCGYRNCGSGCGTFGRRPKPTVCYHDRPFGWYVRNANQIQVARGFQDQMVLYHYDFQEGVNEDQLSSRGRQQLEKFAQMVDSHGFPVVIQPVEGRPELDAARQAHAAMELSTMTQAAMENSVVVARPRAPGLRGVEAYEIDQNLLRQTQNRGRLMSGAGGGGGFGFDFSGIESGVGGSSQ
ncbi:MAG: hypothetical protein OES79_00310 [Planctomycetota bacterium]|nr:hypothetical protein [Planctomycetota bacterium]